MAATDGIGVEHRSVMWVVLRSDVILSSGEAGAKDRTTDGYCDSACGNAYDANIELIPYSRIGSARPRTVPRTGFAVAQDDITHKHFRNATNCDL